MERNKGRPGPLKVVHAGPPTVLKEKPELRATVPTTPHFASDDRIKARQMKAALRTNQSNGVNDTVEGNTAPGGDSASNRPGGHRSAATPTRSVSSAGRRRSQSPAIRGDKPSVTVTKPFSFEEREKHRKELREEKLRREREEEEAKRRFHANPLPSFEPNLPPKNPMPATNPQPFNLKVDERGTKHQEVFRQKLRETERIRKEQATFHANPPTVIFQKPFEPEASSKLPTEPLDIQLNSDRRAVEREMFDSQIRERELLEEQYRQQDEKNRFLMEQQQAQELRKQLVHKAQPVKGIRAFEVKHSEKPLTNPMSPAFAPLPSQRRNLHQIHENIQPE